MKTSFVFFGALILLNIYLATHLFFKTTYGERGKIDAPEFEKIYPDLMSFMTNAYIVETANYFILEPQLSENGSLIIFNKENINSTKIFLTDLDQNGRAEDFSIIDTSLLSVGVTDDDTDGTFDTLYFFNSSNGTLSVDLDLDGSFDKRVLSE